MKIKNKFHLCNNFSKYVFVSFLLFIGSASAQPSSIINNKPSDVEICATCAGPSDEMKNYRNFLNENIKAITLKKQPPIVGNDNVLGLLKNADRNIKNINYNNRKTKKKTFRIALYNGKDTVMGMSDYAKDLLKFGNNTRIKELQTMDKFSDGIDQLAIKLIESNQINQIISNSDAESLKKILTKYTSSTTKIFASNIMDEVKGKTYFDYMRFLLNINEKMQFFVINGTLKDINTIELSEALDLSAAWDTKFVKNITKSYSCSRVLYACDKMQKDLNLISKDSSIKSKFQKNQIQSSINGLKDAMSRFNSVVLGVQKDGFNADYTDISSQKFFTKNPDNDAYNEMIYGSTYKGGSKNGFFGQHFQVNTNIDSKITNMISDGEDTLNKTKNTQVAKEIKQKITKLQVEKSDIATEYQIDINNRQSYLASSNLVLAKSDMNDFITDAMKMQDDYMDKNVLSESESITKLFPNLSKNVYINVNNIGNRSESSSCLTNFVDMCNYQCANLGGNCEPALN